MAVVAYSRSMANLVRNNPVVDVFFMEGGGGGAVYESPVDVCLG